MGGKRMNKRVAFGLIIFLSITSCVKFQTTSTPPPGWRILVSNLFIDASAFPEGTSIDYTDPEGKESDPTINHFFRTWVGLEGETRQTILRSYTVADAETVYDELRVSLFTINGTPLPEKPFSAYVPPEEFHFENQLADEYYFACGQWDGYNCEFLARYRNYVTNVHFPLATSLSKDPGMTYAQMKSILTNVDQKFSELFATLK
jgi:hypothetical protein